MRKNQAFYYPFNRRAIKDQSIRKLGHDTMLNRLVLLTECMDFGVIFPTEPALGYVYFGAVSSAWKLETV